MDVANVVFVTQWRWYHLFISCPFVRIIWHMIYFTYNISPASNITNIFGNWLNGIDTDSKLEFALEFLLCVGQYGHGQTLLSLTNKMVQVLCWLFDWPRIGYITGPTSSRWISGSIWLLVATGFWWLLGTSFSRLLDGGILIEFKMNSFLLLLIFQWLIHVSTLSDLWM
jgi:hypothetical protein